MPAVCDGFDDILLALRVFGAGLPSVVFWGAAALWGLLIGSFATVAMERWPAIIEGRMPASALWYPGSRCPPCGRPLSLLRAMPLLGFAIARGRCACGERAVPWRYPLVEAGGMVFMLAAVALSPGGADRTLSLAGIASALYLLAIIDLRSGYLPDTLTLGLLWSGLLATTLGPCGLDSLAPAEAIAGAAGGWLLMAGVAGLARLRYGTEALARGDWKLVAAVGAWGGPEALFQVLALGALIALALVPLLPRLGPIGTGGAPRAVPFGPALALAALPVLSGTVSALIAALLP